MKSEERKKMFKDVFAPKPGEKVLFLVDTPHDDVKDNKIWKERREMAQEWYNTFKKMGEEADFSVEMMKYKATGVHNSPVPQNVIDAAKKSNLLLAMTEFSGTSTLLPLCRGQGST